MNNIFEWSFSDWLNKIRIVFRYVLSKWYFLLFGCLAGGLAGYFINRNIKPTYTATISFVLSTESKSAGAGYAGIASQLGLDIGINDQDNIFSGDNIVELFKSTKLIKQTLLAKPDSASSQSLLNLIAYSQFHKYKSILPFPSDPKKFSEKQNSLLRLIIQSVNQSFNIFKKDKKLVFYYISATSENEDIAYYIAKCMLEQTSDFFIQTKTSAARRGLKLLQNEADSLTMVLTGTFRSSASVTDRTYNINPSLMAQRAGTQLNQAKAMAVGAGYTEVVRGLEMAKINVLKATPLFSVIDEADRPLMPQKISVVKRSIFTAIIGVFIMVIILSGIRIYSALVKSSIFKGEK